MKKKLAVLLAAAMLVLSCSGCTDSLNKKDPVEPEIPPVTVPEDDQVLDDVVPDEDTGAPSEELPDPDVPDDVLPDKDVLDDDVTKGDITDDDPM